MPETWHGRRDKRPVPTDFSESLRHLQREPIIIILVHPLRPQPVIVLVDTVEHAVDLSTTQKIFPMNREISLNVVVIDDETVAACAVVVPMVAGASRSGAKWSVDG